jgi:hypothetical protein
MFVFYPTNHTMFDFLSKLFSGRSETRAESSEAKDATSSKNEIKDQNPSRNAGDKQTQLAQQRQVWKQKLDAAIHNEAIVIEMLLACDFADGRLDAAQHIHSKQGLEQVRDACRKSDKRVTKLMQTKLDAIADQEKNLNAAQQCVDMAAKLLALDFVLPNHLIDLDTQKQSLRSFPEPLQSQFQSLREQLESRMGEQVQLQRRLLNLIAEIESELKLGGVSTAASKLELQDHWHQELGACLNHPLANSLPKHTVQDAENVLRRHHDKVMSLNQSTNEASLPESKNTISTVDETRDDQVQYQTEETKQDSDNPVKEIPPAVISPANVLSAAQFAEALDGLERALQEGSFQQAKPFEKQLREVDLNAAPKYLNRTQKDRLSQARKQFNHLLSWAKWSGDASREELVNTAEGLANLKLDPNEIVDTVTALRAQWKQMEASSGGAAKELWLRFDAACSAAYAPAAAHFQQQAEFRKENVAKAEQKLNEMRSKIEGLLQVEKNWKTIGLAIIQMQQEWKRVGPFDRKEKARLDQGFNELLQPLIQIFGAEQEQAIQHRRELIQEAKTIDSSARNAADQIRALQARWQISASHIALERKIEQELWLEFRSACDAIFEARKQLAASADQERQLHLQQKKSVCDKLERFLAEDIAVLKQFRQQIQAEWQAIGPVPRQDEVSVNRRFEQGIERLQKAFSELELQAKRQRLEGVLLVLSVVEKAEAVLTEHVIDEQKWTMVKQEWEVLEIPRNRTGRSLKQRWDSLIQLFANRDDGVEVRRVLLGNAVQVDHLILSLEILLQLDSPAQLSQERRKAQLEILQQSMKQGKDQEQLKTMLYRLFSLTVAFELERQKRVQAIAQNATEILLAA